MVSFQCEGCGDVLTKKKLDPHANRCPNAYFSCIDCMQTFHDYSYRQHTTCMTEAQKTHGSLYKGNEKRPRAKPTSKMNSQPQTPTAVDEMQVAKVDVPPPAPSPPRQTVNVFDFMVTDQSPSTMASSPQKSNGHDTPRSLHPDNDEPAHASRGFSYGEGPVKNKSARFTNDGKTSNDDQFGPALTAQTPNTAGNRHLKTPKPNGVQDKAKSTEKKRKRPQVDDLDLSDTKNDSSDTRRSLHTGLTGGLSKLLEAPSSRVEEASPLSPKKRSKHKNKQDDSEEDESEAERRRRKRDRRDSKHKRHRSDGDDLERQLVRTDAGAKAVQLHSQNVTRRVAEKKQLPEQANSEFFLTLVDKEYTSSKGQSIWGTLKTFHEGLQAESMEDAFDLVGAHQRAEKRLFKGLRMKLNKHGEVVLFAKPSGNPVQRISPGTSRFRNVLQWMENKSSTAHYITSAQGRSHPLFFQQTLPESGFRLPSPHLSFQWRFHHVKVTRHWDGLV